MTHIHPDLIPMNDALLFPDTNRAQFAAKINALTGKIGKRLSWTADSADLLRIQSLIGANDPELHVLSCAMSRMMREVRHMPRDPDKIDFAVDEFMAAAEAWANTHRAEADQMRDPAAEADRRNEEAA